MKQTAVEWLVKNYLDNPLSNEDVIYNINVFQQAKKMEKEQQERMYSEEEVKNMINDFDASQILFNEKYTYKVWFEQFKKK